MSYTMLLRNTLRSACFLVLLVAVMASLSTVAGSNDHSQVDMVQSSEIHGQSQAQEQIQPKANLPFLFAVFFVTWAVFFGYVFVLSRRQKEMRREIESLIVDLKEEES